MILLTVEGSECFAGPRGWLSSISVPFVSSEQEVNLLMQGRSVIPCAGQSLSPSPRVLSVSRAGGPAGLGHEWFELCLLLKNSEMPRERKEKEAELRMTACPAVLVCGAGKPWAGRASGKG